MTDWDLIQAFSKAKSDKAFTTLSERYRNFVYSVCLREVGNSALAEDTTQAVFLLLARKAGSFNRGVVLMSWLFKTARLASRDGMRQEWRRIVREQKAYDMAQHEARDVEAGEATWMRIEPYFNDAMAGLREPEKKVVFLRLVQGLSLAETGVALGISEEAARKRIDRAVEKLRRRLAKAGIPIAGATLAILIFERSVQACTPAVAQGIAAILSGAPVSVRSELICQGAIKTMQMLKLRTALISVGIVAVVAVSIVGGLKAVSKPAALFASGGASTRASSLGISPLLEVPMPPTGLDNASSRLVEKYIEVRASGNLSALKTMMDPSLAKWETPEEVAWEARDLRSPDFLTSQSPSGVATCALLYDYKNTLGFRFCALGPTKTNPNEVLVEAYRPGPPPSFTTVVVLTRPAISPGGQLRLSLVADGNSNINSMDSNQVANCLNLIQIRDAIFGFAHAHEGRMPDAMWWMDEISPFLQGKGKFQAPHSPFDFSYALNRNISGLTLRQIPSPKTTVLVFNSTLNTKNASDDGKSLPRPGFDWNASPEIRSPSAADRGNDFIFADGHIDWLPDSAKPRFNVNGP